MSIRSPRLPYVTSRALKQWATRPGSLLIPQPSTSVVLLVVSRKYATQAGTSASQSSTRKQITITSDDGRVRWGELSAREKAARTTQQTFNFLTVLAGLVATV